MKRSLVFLLFLTLSHAWGSPVGTSQAAQQDVAGQDVTGQDATGQDFAALSVRPDGPEELDLATGITTLPEGGEILYRAQGVRLVGGYIRFLEGDFIEVQEATVTGEFGVLEAPELRFEVVPQRLLARSATFVSEAVELSADTAELELTQNIAVLSGNVTSTDPELTGARALVDLTGQQALLIGPYAFSDGPVALRGDEGKLLALRWDASGALSAETQIPPVLKMRFADLLP